LDPDGIVMTPRNIHASLRQLAGIEDHPFTVGTDVGEALPLFDQG